MSAAVHDDELFKQIVCQTWNVKDDLAEPAPLRLMSLSSPSTRKSSTDILSRYGDQNDFETHSTGMLKVTATEVSIASRGPHAPNKASDSAVPPVNLCKQPNPALGYLMQKLRSELKVRIGGTGFLALQRLGLATCRPTRLALHTDTLWHRPCPLSSSALLHRDANG